MERLKERILMASKALQAFKEVMNISDPSDIERDAAIQRFEFTFEAVWESSFHWLTI